MKPYYDDEWVTIFNGDCREVLPTIADGSVDMLLTDPPYGMDIGYGRTALGLRRIAGDEDAGLLEWVAREAGRLLPASGWSAVFCGYSQVGMVQNASRLGGLTVKTVVVWDKAMPSLGEGIRNQHEMVVLSRKGHPAESWQGGNVWRFTRESGRPDHPHQKPLKILHRLVGHYSEPGATVLDPFMGSGSTVRAAKNCGRRTIGIEVDERYCELAATRCAQEVFEFGEAA